MNETLTEKEYWENYWENNLQPLPKKVEIVDNKYNAGVYLPFEQFLDKNKPLSILDIGGAPGLVLASMTKIHNRLSLGILDYSDRGIEESKRVFKKYNLKGQIHKANLFEDDLSQIPKYDVVYSLGVVEHYLDLENSLNKHLELTKTGGIVIIGLPVFLGINKWLINKLAPKNMSTMYAKIMNKRTWKQFKKRKDFKILFNNYTGGFNPHVHHRLENKSSTWRRVVHGVLHKYFARIWDKIPYTNKLNSKFFSFYYYFVIEKTSESAVEAS